jgi:hypothetical protein
MPGRGRPRAFNPGDQHHFDDGLDHLRDQQPIVKNGSEGPLPLRKSHNFSGYLNVNVQSAVRDKMVKAKSFALGGDACPFHMEGKMLPSTGFKTAEECAYEVAKHLRSASAGLDADSCVAAGSAQKKRKSPRSSSPPADQPNPEDDAWDAQQRWVADSRAGSHKNRRMRREKKQQQSERQIVPYATSAPEATLPPPVPVDQNSPESVPNAASPPRSVQLLQLTTQGREAEEAAAARTAGTGTSAAAATSSGAGDAEADGKGRGPAAAASLLRPGWVLTAARLVKRPQASLGIQKIAHVVIRQADRDEGADPVNEEGFDQLYDDDMQLVSPYELDRLDDLRKALFG